MSNDLRVVAVLAGPVQPAPAHFALVERLEAVLHQGVGPHVVVGRDHQPAERMHQREVPVPSVTGAEQVLDQPVQALVAQPAAQIADELLLLPRADVVQLAVGARLLEQRIVFLLGHRAGIVAHDQGRRVAVAPEVLVIES